LSDENCILFYVHGRKVMKRVVKYLGMTIICLLLLANGAWAGIIFTSGFENPEIPDNSPNWRVYENVDGWSLLSGQGIEVQENSVVTAHGGDQYVELDSDQSQHVGDTFGSGDTNSIMGRTISLTAGHYTLNFYYQPRKYPLYGVKSSDEISRMFVTDYLDGGQVDASRAWYVFGSRVIGPHGDDLIPLSSETKAKLFTDKYGGTKIMNYETLRKKGFGLIRYLDM